VTAVQVVLQRLLVLAAAVALLGHGGLEIAPRIAQAGSSLTAAAATSPPTPSRAASRPAAESAPVAPVASLRVALALQAPSSGGETAAGPGSRPLVAPHLVAQPVVRPPTPSYVLGPGGGASGRAPPVPAGT
jgi:hypothetical protein